MGTVDGALRTMVVVNPSSANGKTRQSWPAIRDELGRTIGEVDFQMTGRRGDATRIARRAIGEGYEMVVSLGGDGTHNEVLNGFFDEACVRPLNPEAILGIISSGTGGDFRKTLGLRDWRQAVGALAGRATRTIDVGRMRLRDPHGTDVPRMFLNIASFGVGGEVDEKVNSTTKAFGGFASFLIGSLRALARYRNKPVRISVDGAPPEDIVINNVAVANGRFFGGGMMVAPKAELDDGRFDVIVMGDLRFHDIAFSMAKIYKGAHLGHPKVRALHGRLVEATSTDRVLLDVDGEQPGMLPARFEIVPGALRVKVAG